MDTSLILPLITAFGLGSVITALIQSYLAGRASNAARNFQEKKEAYVGLLQAFHRAGVEGTEEAAKEFAYWQMRCELVASKEVRDAIVEVIKTNDDRPKRNIAVDKLQDALRADLGVLR